MKLIIFGTESTFETRQLLLSAEKMGIAAKFCSIEDIVLSNKKEFQILVDGEDILNFDVFIFRGLGRFFREYTTIALYLKEKGKVIIDEKLATTKYTTDKTLTYVLCELNGIPYPKTVQIFSKENIRFLQEELSPPYIVKETISSRGRGIYLFNNFDDLKKFLEKRESLEKIIIQEQLRREVEDYRVFVVGNKVLGIMKKIAVEGEYRSNVAQGGKTEMIDDPQIKELAVKAAKITHTEVAGVDIMLDEHNKPHVLEVNRSPQFHGFMQVSDVNVADEIIKYTIEKYKQGQ